MKNIKYILFSTIFLFLNILNVEASCTNNDIKNLKDLAEDIKITYKHKGKVETEEGAFYNIFDVRVKNVPDDFYVSLYDGTVKLEPIDGEILEEFNNGTWYFDIYSNKCNERITQIKVFIPRFNVYSLDPLCEGIDGDDFSLCGKYYEYDVSYDDFVTRVNDYRNRHNIDSDNTSINDNDNNNIFGKILDVILIYKNYILIALGILLTILLIIMVINRKKKRGVLE